MGDSDPSVFRRKNSYLSLEAAKLPCSTHCYSVYAVLAAVLCEDVWCDLNWQSLTMTLDSWGCRTPYLFEHRFWPLPVSLLPWILYCQHSGVPTWEWQHPQNLVQGILSNLIRSPRVFQCLSFQRELLTLCLIFSLILQDFNSSCPNVLLMFLQLWAWGGCKIAGLRTCSEGLTEPWKSRKKRSIHFDKMLLCPYF